MRAVLLMDGSSAGSAITPCDKSRLDRKLDAKPFGSPDYGKEELVAEMSAAFLCSHAGIQPTLIENQATYLSGWLKQLKSDKKAAVSAAGRAQKAADWILARRAEGE